VDTGPIITATPYATHSMKLHFSFRNDMGTTSFPHNLFIYGSLNNVISSSDYFTVKVMLMAYEWNTVKGLKEMEETDCSLIQGNMPEFACRNCRKLQNIHLESW
jgi:hypothetical protein